MIQPTTLRAALAFLIFVLGSLQAWDSDVHEAGLLIVLLVILLFLAPLLSPIPLPGLFLILVPAAMGLIFTGLIRKEMPNES